MRIRIAAIALLAAAAMTFGALTPAPETTRSLCGCASAIAPRTTLPRTTDPVQDGQRRPFDWESASPFVVMTEALILSGEVNIEAARVASEWVEHWTVDLNDGQGRHFALDWDGATLYPMLLDLFRFAGKNGEEASDLAAASMNHWGLGSYTINGDDECLFYNVTIVYCTENPLQKHITTRVLEAACWEMIADCPVDQACTGNTFPWHTLTIRENCPETTPALLGECVWIGNADGPYAGDCTLVELHCDCFEEADPEPDCEAIEQVCGHEQFGPMGCPDCDPEE